MNDNEKAADPKQDFSRHPLWDDLSALEPSSVALKSGAAVSLTAGSPVYTLGFMGADYELRLRERNAVSPPGRPELGYYPKIVLLSYLLKSATGPSPGLASREVGPHSLPWGDLFFQGPHELPKALLADAFGDDPEALGRASALLGAERTGKLAWKARVLPNVEVYWYLEPPDDEFPAESRFNYDANICYYLGLDMIFGLSNHLAETLVSSRCP
ncbi:MAG: DUF3786 domain-containing protein [Deltaproteobacteria bacterium]|jgi:hypothetical protein|nr:DUF3786 domain-containing protein [Deltaproteobacteria bacterium]